MKVNFKDVCIKLDPDVYAALASQLKPGETVVDLANQLLRELLVSDVRPDLPNAELPPLSGREQGS